MKKSINIMKLILAVISIFMTVTISAQGTAVVKTDKVIFLDGMIKEGRITSFANDKIEFVHSGETVKYEFGVNKIEKIEYASGRIEQFSGRRRVVFEAPMNSKNRVAIMPLTYIGDGNESRLEEMKFQLQNLTVSFLRNSTVELKFMGATAVNATLFKNGISDETIRLYTPEELAALLHVEYIIMGSVIQDAGSIVTVNKSYANRRQNISHHDYHRGRINNRIYRNERTETRQNIETRVSISIYNETGENIYVKSRHSLLTGPDAYRNAIQYLLKRSPLYKR